MSVQGLGFLGIRVADPARYAATVALYRELLALPVINEEPDRFVWFRLGDGTQVHVYGPLDEDHVAFGDAPCVGFRVDDPAAHRSRLEAAGIAFLWETQRDGAVAWAHFRGPDGAVYELIGSDRSGGDRLAAREESDPGEDQHLDERPCDQGDQRRDIKDRALVAADTVKGEHPDERLHERLRDREDGRDDVVAGIRDEQQEHDPKDQ